MRLLYFCLLCMYLLIATCFAFRGKNELLEDNLPNMEIAAKINTPDSKDLAKAENGKKLFLANCASCHNKNMKDDMTAPALTGVKKRWEGREDLLKGWIRNSPEVIESGDVYANELFKKWNKSVMLPFPNLSDEEIETILDYIELVGRQ